MTDSALDQTKRELRRMFFAPRFWALLLGIGFVLGIAGPFGTYENLALLPRLAYWTGIAVTTYFTGLVVLFLLVGAVWRGREPGPAGYAMAGAVVGLPVAVVVTLVNWQVFDDFEGVPAFLVLVVYCAAISATVSALVAMISAASGTQHAEASGRDAVATPERPAILDRLPVHLRGRLLYLSMQDHYVDVRTDRGGTLVLMRFADAIAETRGTPGLRIHRSHWVALDAVAGTTRRDGRPFVKMADGEQLPVSRSCMAAAREAGLV